MFSYTSFFTERLSRLIGITSKRALIHLRAGEYFAADSRPRHDLLGSAYRECLTTNACSWMPAFAKPQRIPMT